MTAETKKRGLGRGLDALFQDVRKEEESFAPRARGDETPVRRADEIAANPYETKSMAPQPGVNIQRRLPVERLTPGKYQPRRFFEDAALVQLSESIAAHGVLQPLLVRPLATGMYEIIAGERRWRAAQKAQVHEVPVVIQDLDDQQALEIALVENLQREDLTALEEAEGYQRLIDDFGHTQEALARQLGKSRSHVANMLRLLKLPAAVKQMIQQGTLSAGHARALIGAENAEELASIIVRRALSVRGTEALARRTAEAAGKGKPGTKSAAKKKTFGQKDVDVLALESLMGNKLGMKVTIDSDGPAGTLSIDYKSLDQLDDLLARLGQPARRPQG
jgi:ParB family transcriptional regulator, chromosome partitioning protein